MKKCSALKFLPILVLILASCSSKTEKLQSKKEKTRNTAALSLYKSMICQTQMEHEEALTLYIKNLPLEKKIAQLFIENLEGNRTFRSLPFSSPSKT